MKIHIPNKTGEHLNGQNTTEILVCSMMTTTLLFDLVCLFTIIKSRTKLIKTELFILLAIQLTALAYKTFSLLISLAIVANIFIFGSSTCIYLYPGLFSTSTTFNTILVFYSLLHASALRKTRFEQKLFVAVRQFGNFGIFFLLASVSISFAMVTFFIIFHDRVIADPLKSTCHLDILDPIISAAVCLSNAPLIPVISVYLISIMRILWGNSANSGRNGRNNHRKILRISQKFLSFILVPVLGFTCRLAVPISAALVMGHSYSETTELLFTKIVHLLIFTTFSLEPIVLTYIHNILFSTFRKHIVRPILRIFCCFLKKKSTKRMNKNVCQQQNI